MFDIACPVERVLISHSAHATFSFRQNLRAASSCNRELSDQLGLCELHDLFCNRFQTAKSNSIAIDDHIDLESLVFVTEKHFLVLIASYVAECVTLLATDREGHQNIVKHLAFFLGTVTVGRVGVITRERTI